VQTPQTVSITLPARHGTSATFLPFLGDPQKLQGTLKEGVVSFTLPPITKGAVFWLQNQ
jgi:hypothetical protein